MQLDVSGFKAPKHGRPTRHLYVANCGRAKGDTVDSIMAALQAVLGSDVASEVEAVRLGDAGVSYVTFVNLALAAQTREALLQPPSSFAEHRPHSDWSRWVTRFAEHALETGKGAVPMPGSVAATADVEVPGIAVVQDFVSDVEASTLLEAIDAREWDTTIKRRVQHYGHAFDYARLALGSTVDHLPDFCTDVVSRLNDSGLLPYLVDQLTVNEYQPGVGIASHVDAHTAFEDGIAALSLGSGIVMEFRKPIPEKGGKVSMGKHHRLAPAPPEEAEVIVKSVWLPANSLLVIRGEARYGWQHGIAWRKTDCLAEGEVVARSRRVSLTFRAARRNTEPCQCAWPAMCDGQNPEAHALPSRVGVGTRALADEHLAVVQSTPARDNTEDWQPAEGSFSSQTVPGGECARGS